MPSNSETSPSLTPTSLRDLESQSVPKIVGQGIRDNINILKNQEGLKPHEVVFEIAMNDLDVIGFIGSRMKDVLSVTGNKSKEITKNGLVKLGNVTGLPLGNIEKSGKLTPSTIGANTETLQSLNPNAATELITNTNEAIDGNINVLKDVDQNQIPVVEELAKRRKKKTLAEILGFTPKEEKELTLEDLEKRVRDMEKREKRRVIWRRIHTAVRIFLPIATPYIKKGLKKAANNAYQKKREEDIFGKNGVIDSDGIVLEPRPDYFDEIRPVDYYWNTGNSSYFGRKDEYYKENNPSPDNTPLKIVKKIDYNKRGPIE